MLQVLNVPLGLKDCTPRVGDTLLAIRVRCMLQVLNVQYGQYKGGHIGTIYIYEKERQHRSELINRT